MRLGLNTYIQDWYTKSITCFPETIYRIDKFLLWQWNKVPRYHNFGYPFTVDCNTYKTQDIIKNLTFDFDNPNTLESTFVTDSFSPMMACLENSCVINNPLNLTGSSNNNAGYYFNQYTLEFLNEKYLHNYHISFESILKNQIIACHQEMDIHLIEAKYDI